MKKGTKRKILFISLGIIFLLSATAFTLAKTGFFVKQFKSIIEAELTKALNREVTIERIEGGIFDSIDLVNVRIASNKEVKDGLLVVIDKISIKYNFKDIVFNKKKVLESLKGIEFVRPSLLMEKTEQGTWNIADFVNSLPESKNQVFPSGLPVTISKGLIGIKDSKKKFNSSIRDINGRIDFSKDGKFFVKIGSKGFSSKKTNLYIDGITDLKNKTSALVITGRDLELSHYAAYVLLHLPGLENYQIAVKEGKFDILANFSDTFSVDLHLKNGGIYFAGLKTGFTGIMSDISFTKESLKIKKFASVLKNNSSVTAKGEIRNLFKGEPEGKVNIFLNQLELADFGAEKIFKGLNPSGICNAGIILEGPFSSPSVNVFANVRDLRLAGFRTDNNDLVIKYKNKKAVIEKLKINAFDGFANLTGTYDFGSDNLLLAGNALDVQLAEFFNFAGVPGAKGKAAFALEIKGPFKDIKISSKFMAKKVSLVSGALGDITGNLFFEKKKLNLSINSTENISMQTVFTFGNDKIYADGYLRLAGADFKNAYGYFVENKLTLNGESTAVFSIKGPVEDITLSGDVVINNFNFDGYKAKTAKGNLTIKKGLLVGTGLYFNQDDTGYLKAEGSMGLTGDMPLNLLVTASRTDFSALPVFNTYYKIAGRGAFAARILGSIARPKFITTLTSDNLMLDGRQSLKADLSFTYENSVLKIDRLNFDDEYVFNGDLTFLNKTYIDSVLSVKNGKLSTLFTVFKIPRGKEEVKGTINGGARLNGNFDNLSGEGELNTQDAEFFGESVRKLGLKFAVKDGVAAVKQFNYVTDDILLDAGGIVSFKNNGGTVLDLNMRNNYGKNNITGSYKIKAFGLFDNNKSLLFAKLQSKKLSFNGETVGNIFADAGYSKKENQLFLSQLAWENISGKAEYSFKNKVFSAGLKFAASDLKKLSFLDAEMKKNLVKGELTGVVDLKTDKEGGIKVNNQLTITALQYNDFKAKRITANFIIKKTKPGYHVLLSRFLVSQEKGSLDFNGSLSSSDFSPEKTDCELTVSLSGVNVKNLFPLIKSKLDIGAELQSVFGIKIKGKLSDPVVSGECFARDVRSGTLLLGDFHGEFVYSNSVLKFKKLSFDDSRLDNHAVFEKAVFAFKKDFIEAQLAATVELKQIFGLRLKAYAEAKSLKIIPGDNIRLESDLFINNLKMNEYAMSGVSLRLSSEKNVLTLYKNIDTAKAISTAEGKITFNQNESVRFKDVVLTVYDNTVGTVKLNGESGGTSNLIIDVNNANIKWILKYFDLDFNMTGTVNNARALYSGPASAPKVKVGGSLRDVNAFNMAFSSVTGDMNFTNNKLTLSKVQGVQKDSMLGELYSVRVEGDIPLNQEEEQDLHISLKNTGLQPVMITGWFNDVEGKMDADLKIKGKLSYPVVSRGYLEVKEGSRVVPSGFIKQADKLKTKIIIENNRAEIAYLSFEVDKSPIEVFGNFTLKKFYPDELNIKIRNTQTAARKGFKFKIASIMEKEGTVYAKGAGADEFFSISGKANNFMLKGDLHLYDTKFTWPPEYKEGDTAPRILKEMIWNLKVVIEESVWYYNTYCNAKLKNGSIISSSGPGGDLEMRGGAEIEQGFLKFAGIRFDIKTASFIFLENTKRSPALVAAGEYSTSTHRIFLNVRGKKGLYAVLGDGENFDATLTSQPEETQEQIIKILGRFGGSSFESARASLISMVAAQVINEGLTKILEGIAEAEVVVRPTSKPYSSNDLNVFTEKTAGIFEDMQFSVSKLVAENARIRGTIFRDYKLSSLNSVSVYLPEVSIELGAGSRKYNFALNPNEYKFGVSTVVVFDNDTYIEQNKKKGKEK